MQSFQMYPMDLTELGKDKSHEILVEALEIVSECSLVSLVSSGALVELRIATGSSSSTSVFHRR